MIFVGHVAATILATQLYIDRTRRRIDLRKMAVISMLPDLIDKPLAFCFPEFFGYHTRLYAHSLLFCLVMIPVFRALRRRLGPPLICWLVLAGHLLMDRVWITNKEMFFWPLLDDAKPQPKVALDIFNWTAFQPANFEIEIAGVLILCVVAAHYRLYRKEKLLLLLKTGNLQ